MYFLLNLSHYVKSYGHYVKFWHFIRCPLSKYGHVTWPKKQILKKFYFFLILHLILGKVTKFLEESSLLRKLSAKNLTGGGKHSPPGARSKFDGGVAGSEDFASATLPTTPLDFQGNIKNFCHPTLLKIRFKIIVNPPPPLKRAKSKLRCFNKL